MLLNLNPMKQVVEVCFSNKHDKEIIPPLNLNSDDEQLANTQKHLPLVLGMSHISILIRSAS